MLSEPFLPTLMEFSLHLRLQNSWVHRCISAHCAGRFPEKSLNQVYLAILLFHQSTGSEVSECARWKWMPAGFREKYQEDFCEWDSRLRSNKCKHNWMLTVDFLFCVSDNLELKTTFQHTDVRFAVGILRGSGVSPVENRCATLRLSRWAETSLLSDWRAFKPCPQLMAPHTPSSMSFLLQPVRVCVRYIRKLQFNDETLTTVQRLMFTLTTFYIPTSMPA